MGRYAEGEPTSCSVDPQKRSDSDAVPELTVATVRERCCKRSRHTVIEFHANPINAGELISVNVNSYLLGARGKLAHLLFAFGF